MVTMRLYLDCNLTTSAGRNTGLQPWSVQRGTLSKTTSEELLQMYSRKTCRRDSRVLGLWSAANLVCVRPWCDSRYFCNIPSGVREMARQLTVLFIFQPESPGFGSQHLHGGSSPQDLASSLLERSVLGQHTSHTC